MNSNKITIYTDKDYEEAQYLMNNAFYTNQRILDQVFNKKFSCFLFEEFDWAMTPDFWNTIQQLASISKDTHIITTVLNPDSTNYFFKHFGYFNSFKLPINISGDDYWDLLQTGPKDSPADSMLCNSEVVTWLPLSTKWAIW